MEQGEGEYSRHRQPFAFNVGTHENCPGFVPPSLSTDVSLVLDQMVSDHSF